MACDIILSLLLGIETKHKIDKRKDPMKSNNNLLDEIITFCSTTCLIVLNIYGYVHIKDSNKAIIIDELMHDLARYRVIKEDPHINLEKSSLGKSLGRSDPPNETSPREILQKFLMLSKNKRNNTDPVEQDLMALATFKKSVFDEVEEIEILNSEEIIRNGEETTVFVILYTLKKQISTTKRSYSEFQRLYYKTKDNYPMEDLPPFPAKKAKNDSKKESTIAERKALFEKFLVYVCQKKLYTKYFFEFLKSPKDMPYFGYIIGRESRRESYLPGDARKSESPASKRRKSEEEERKSRESKLTGKTLSFAQPLEASETYSFLRDSKRLKSSSNSNSDMDLGNALINDYNRFLLKSEIEKVYKVNIPKVDIVEEDDKPQIYYHIQISHSGTSRSVRKAYRDFENLHREMKVYAEQNGCNLMELPNKGNLGVMISKTDPKLIDYRKFALKNYLQYVMFDKTLKYCPQMRNFLELDYSIRDSVM